MPEFKQNHKYTLEQKQQLARLIDTKKDEYDEQVRNAPLMYARRKKTWVQRTPSEGYISAAVREFFPGLSAKKSTDILFQQARSFANRCFEAHKRKREEGIDGEEVDCKKRFREPGAGRKAIAPEVRVAAFQWFVDVRGSLKGRLPRKIFRMKCLELFVRWKEATNDIETTFACSDKWINDWMEEYRVSLKHPNKRFALSKEERILRLVEFLKNILRVRYFFHSKFQKDPVIINGDQMPLHRNESAGQKTLSMQDDTTYVKENYMLSRERVTVFTQVSTESNLKPEFVFKGKGKKIHLNPPEGVNTHFAPKGSYRLDTMLQTIENLPNRRTLFRGESTFALYILDDYSVHVTEEVKKAFLQRGYILVCIGGGITGDVQVNDTHYHHTLKKEYREREAKLMLEQLKENPEKVPNPSRDDMMKMLTESWEALEINATKSLKSLFINNALDGSEDHLVSDKLFELVGETIIAYRAELMASTPPQNVKELAKTITPPRGVRRKAVVAPGQEPEDEGCELIDCEGEELSAEELTLEINHREEGGGDDNEAQPPVIQDLPQPSGSGPATQISLSESSVNPSQSQSSKSSSINLSSFATSEDTKCDAEFLDQMKILLENHKTTDTFIPFYLRFKTNYIKARRSLKKRMQVDSEIVKKILQDENNNENDEVSPPQENVPSSQDYEGTQEDDIHSSAQGDGAGDIDSMEVSINEEEEEEEEEKAAELSLGQYCLVTNGRSSLPACITCLDPLAVRYYEVAKLAGLHRAGDYVGEILREDIAEIINDPEEVQKGKRKFYRFA